MFYIVFVALATPVGVTIGLVVTEHVDASSGVQTLVIGILQVHIMIQMSKHCRMFLPNTSAETILEHCVS